MVDDRTRMYYMDFLRYSLNVDAEIPDSVRFINWMSLLEFAKKQSVVGIYWHGIQKLGQIKENKPTDDDVLEWMGICKVLERKNEEATERCAWVTNNFLTEGFQACLLKGQGNALLYPDSLLRTPGDIDIWVRPKERKSLKEGVEDVIAYCRKFVPKAKACYHHIDFLKARKIPVEVHYRPSWMNNPFNNKKLQHYFLEHADEQFSHFQPQGFAVPTWEFNLVFQLSHVANHLLHEGIGFRQIIDYYYLLRSNEERQPLSYYENLFRPLGLLPFARQMMWVQCQMLGLDEKLLVAKQDVYRGKLMLSELIEGGDLGKYDERTLSGAYTSPILSNFQRIVRDVRMLRYFPSECIWEPFFRLWHYFWRKKR